MLMQNVQMRSTLSALAADVRWLHVVWTKSCIP